ncbi:MAG: IS4 family transposase, partial [Stellaceae bacterium]
REVLHCLLEGLQWLRDPATPLKVAGKSGISQARTRLGWEALRQLHDAVVRPIAVPATRGAWYRQWRLVSLDGSTLDVADEAANAAALRQAQDRPGSSRGDSAYPQIRFVSLVENGTHVLFASPMAGCETGESALARAVLAGLQRGMLYPADRQFFDFALWQQAGATGAERLWWIKKNIRLPCAQRLLSLSKGRRLLSEPPLYLRAGAPAQDQ